MNKIMLSLPAVPMPLSAQTQRIDNPGLTHPQAESSLPVSRSSNRNLTVDNPRLWWSNGERRGL